jgi:hypothetical protein
VKPVQKVSILALSCREASRLVSESLDRQLTRRERWALRVHTILCVACRRYARQTRMIREAVTNMPDSLREKWSDSTSKLSAERRAQIKHLLADAIYADSHD